jgi:GNAT superfamily N-acetyltransferase
MEPADERILGDPAGEIVNPGGEIFIAERGGRVVGVCALVNHGGREYELAKMAVDASVRGLGIGYRLGQRIVDEARARGGVRIYIESNTVLEPAINLYRKLGFSEIGDHESPYERSNIALDLLLRPRDP